MQLYLISGLNEKVGMSRMGNTKSVKSAACNRRHVTIDEINSFTVQDIKVSHRKKWGTAHVDHAIRNCRITS